MLLWSFAPLLDKAGTKIELAQGKGVRDRVVKNEEHRPLTLCSTPQV